MATAIFVPDVQALQKELKIELERAEHYRNMWQALVQREKALRFAIEVAEQQASYGRSDDAAKTLQNALRKI